MAKKTIKQETNSTNKLQWGKSYVLFSPTHWCKMVQPIFQALEAPDPRNRRSASSDAGRRSNSWRPTCGCAQEERGGGPQL